MRVPPKSSTQIAKSRGGLVLQFTPRERKHKTPEELDPNRQEPRGSCSPVHPTRTQTQDPRRARPKLPRAEGVLFSSSPHANANTRHTPRREPSVLDVAFCCAALVWRAGASRPALPNRLSR